jgi:hypothetical protein
MSKLSERRKLLNQFKYAGTQSDLKEFTRLLLNNRVSKKIADEWYQKGVNFNKFLLNRDLLKIEPKGQTLNNIETLPARRND